MLQKFSTTINKISLVPKANADIIRAFLYHLQNNNSGESHQNNAIQAMTAFGIFLKDIAFADVQKKDQILAFLDRKRKSLEEDPDQRWTLY